MSANTYCQQFNLSNVEKYEFRKQKHHKYSPYLVDIILFLYPLNGKSTIQNIRFSMATLLLNRLVLVQTTIA